MSFNPISNSHVPQIVQKALEISSIQCGSIQFKKMENLRLRYEFVGNYYLFKSEQYLTFVKQHLKSLNSFGKVIQLSLLWYASNLTVQYGGYFGNIIKYFWLDRIKFVFKFAQFV